MQKKLIALVIAGTLLTSCAAKYGKSNFFKGGYCSTRLTDRDFAVSYENGLFSNVINPAKQDQFIIRQAAELTLRHGYTHFTLAPSVNATLVKCYSAEEAPAHAYNAEQVLLFQKDQEIPS